MPSSILRSAPPQKASLLEVTIAPLMAASAVTLSTSIPNSSITLVVMTFIERSAMFQVISAIPSASTSIWKLAIAPSYSSLRMIFSEIMQLVSFAVLFGVTRTLLVAHHHHVDVGIMRAISRSTRADLAENRVAARAVDQAMPIRYAGFPRNHVAGPEHRFATILARLERTNIDPELRKAGETSKSFT